MRRLKLLGGIVLCTCFVGCDQATLMKMFVPPQDETGAEEYVELLRQRKFDLIEKDFEPSHLDPTFRDTLSQMAAAFPDEAPSR